MPLPIFLALAHAHKKARDKRMRRLAAEMHAQQGGGAPGVAPYPAPPRPLPAGPLQQAALQAIQQTATPDNDADPDGSDEDIAMDAYGRVHPFPHPHPHHHPRPQGRCRPAVIDATGAAFYADDMAADDLGDDDDDLGDDDDDLGEDDDLGDDFGDDFGADANEKKEDRYEKRIDKLINRYENMHGVFQKARKKKLARRIRKLKSKLSSIKAAKKASKAALAAALAAGGAAGAGAVALSRQGLRNTQTTVSPEQASAIRRGQARNGLIGQYMAPAGSGRLLRLPFYGTVSPTNIPRSSFTLGAPGLTASVTLTTEDAPYAMFRLVGFVAQVYTSAQGGTSVSSSQVYVEDLKTKGSANLFLHENAGDATMYDTDTDHLVGLRDMPNVRSPNVATVSGSAFIGVANDVIVLSCALVIDIVTDDVFGPGTPGPYAG